VEGPNKQEVSNWTKWLFILIVVPFYNCISHAQNRVKTRRCKTLVFGWFRQVQDMVLRW
jgi:hypothetical protein